MPKPIVGVIKDTHLTSKNIDLVTDVFVQFIALLKSHGIKYAVHLGDFFTNRASHNVGRLKSIKDILKLFEKAKIMLCAIQGNHDLESLDQEIGYMDIYSNPYFRLVHNWEFHVIDDITFHFIPYLLEGDAYMTVLEKVKYNVQTEQNILCTHIAINGVRNNDGSIVTNGIPVEAFKKFDKVIVGHYHEDSFIKPNIYYIPGSYQQNFGESDKKGFTLVYDDGSLKFFRSSFPLYHKVKIEATNKKLIGEFLQDMENMEDLQSINVRLILTGSEEEIQSVEVKVFKDLGIDVRFENTKETVIDFEELDDLELITFTKDQLIKNYEAFAGENEYTDAQRNQGLKYMKTLLR